MLDKVQQYVSYGQKIINYVQKIFAVVNTAVKSWPRWIPFDSDEIKPDADHNENQSV